MGSTMNITYINLYDSLQLQHYELIAEIIYRELLHSSLSSIVQNIVAVQLKSLDGNCRQVQNEWGGVYEANS